MSKVQEQNLFEDLQIKINDFETRAYVTTSSGNDYGLGGDAKIYVVAANKTNTGPMTLDTGKGAWEVVSSSLQPLIGGEFVQGRSYNLVEDKSNTRYILTYIASGDGVKPIINEVDGKYILTLDDGQATNNEDISEVSSYSAEFIATDFELASGTNRFGITYVGTGNNGSFTLSDYKAILTQLDKETGMFKNYTEEYLIIRQDEDFKIPITGTYESLESMDVNDGYFTPSDQISFMQEWFGDVNVDGILNSNQSARIEFSTATPNITSNMPIGSGIYKSTKKSDTKIEVECIGDGLNGNRSFVGYYYAENVQEGVWSGWKEIEPKWEELLFVENVPISGRTYTIPNANLYKEFYIEFGSTPVFTSGVGGFIRAAGDSIPVYSTYFNNAGALSTRTAKIVGSNIIVDAKIINESDGSLSSVRVLGKRK